MKKTTTAEVTINSIKNNDGLSKSKKMIELYLNFPELSISQIAATIGVRYQFSYNVISSYCMMNQIELRKDKKESKKDQIIKIWEESGRTKKISDISYDLRTHQNHVRNVLNTYKKENNIDQ